MWLSALLLIFHITDAGQTYVYSKITCSQSVNYYSFGVSPDYHDTRITHNIQTSSLYYNIGIVPRRIYDVKLAPILCRRIRVVLYTYAIICGKV